MTATPAEIAAEAARVAEEWAAPLGQHRGFSWSNAAVRALLADRKRLRGLVGTHSLLASDHCCACGHELEVDDDCDRCDSWGEVTGHEGFVVACPNCVGPAFSAHVAAVLEGRA